MLHDHKRTSEVAVNLALMRAAYARDRVRAAVGLMAGTYARYNLAAEPPALQYLNEAAIGVRLSSKLISGWTLVFSLRTSVRRALSAYIA